MNKNFLLPVSVLVFALVSCTKHTPPVDPPDNTPLQLVKKIRRYTQNEQIVVDSTGYQYDEAGHLTVLTDLNAKLDIQKFVYNGDNLTAIISGTDTLKNPVTLLDNGNTIFIDFTRPVLNGAADTIQLTYKWSGDQLLEAWTYLHFANQSFPASLQKSFFSYDTDGNESEHVILFNDGNSQWQTRGLEYDNKKNFFKTLSRLNYIFMGWGFPYASRSVNNPLKAESFLTGPTEFIWTYNAEGYGQTMQIKGQSYVAIELKFNR